MGVVPYNVKCILKFYSNAESNITEVITLQGTFLSNTEINTKIANSSGRDAVDVVPYKVNLNFAFSEIRIYYDSSGIKMKSVSQAGMPL